MPYSHERNGKTLKSVKKDRRVKLTDEDKQDIKNKYNSGLYSIRGLAREYKVDKRNIQFLLFPERLEQAKRTLQARGGWRVYYNRLEHNEAVKQTRRHRHKIFKGDRAMTEKEVSGSRFNEEGSDFQQFDENEPKSYRICKRCKTEVFKNSKGGGDYPYECLKCDESLYEFETILIRRP